MILHGADIVTWVHQRMPDNLGFDNPVGLALITDNKLMGGVVFDNYRPETRNISISIAIDDKKCLTRQNILNIGNYVFNQIGAKRVNATILKSNIPSQVLTRRLGFMQEGTLRQASLNDEDLLIFGLLRHEFESKWLKSSRHT